MTEAEWLASTNPVEMIKASRSRLRHRKLRLFAVACCRCISDVLTDQRSHVAIDTAERFADGDATEDELRTARSGAAAVHALSFRQRGKAASCIEWAAEYVADPSAIHAAKNVSWMAATPREQGQVTGADYSIQAVLLRDILVNPFRSVTLDQGWLTADVIKTAQAIYERRSFEGLLILADALEDAGCQNKEILDHCRQPGPHVRGCWVVDLVLGKE